MLCADGEKGVEVYSCTSDRAQASLVFSTAVSMVEMNDSLRKRMKIFRSQKRMIYKPNGSFYQVVSQDAYRQHGINTSCVIYDELHAAPNPELFHVMTKGSGDSRDATAFLLLTTAGDSTTSICYKQHCKAKDILDGKKQDFTFLPIVYSIDEDDDWTDPVVWAKANPSMGITFDIEKVWNACESAKQNPSEEQVFRQLRLNQWRHTLKRWMSSVKWDACAFPVAPDKLIGRICYAGLDLSSTTDYTVLALVSPPPCW